ncbi:unnamed protein product [Arctia plantaginis]|uniref:C2H2-type domain-containing protein n=1 Tax=Arctia plantaginis TaxID=874455 RepID=A0A8S1BUK8_ARCPL|nr:unnamed protein product [Arctia plantaginis]CAB3260792.1 unnamed protein product [Arctia plantaginis]
MDRLSELRGEAGSSQDSTLDTTSSPTEAFMTANESSSKFYSLSEVDATFDISCMKDDISSIKDVSLATTTSEAEGTMTNSDELISNLSPIRKKTDLDTFKIHSHIEAANILSGGVAIFDDNSYDGSELVIDDNVEVDEKSNPELKQTENLEFKSDENIETGLISEETDIGSKDTEVLLQIDGKNVDAIDIGNGLYLYRKEGQEELAAVQIIDNDQQQPSFKFLKVRENAEGNLEVYEEIEVEVSKEVPAKESKTVDRSTPSHVPIRDINKVISDSTCNRATDKQIKVPKKEPIISTIVENENKELLPESKSEVNFNGKMMKLSESRKSPVIGSYTPMTYHSTPKKEGIPLTKTMVDQQLHPNRHSDLSNNKKTIEVHTDSGKKTIETPSKSKDIDDTKINEVLPTEKEIITTDKDVINLETNNKNIMVDKEKGERKCEIKESSEKSKLIEKDIDDKIIKDISEQNKDIRIKQDGSIDSTENKVANKQIEITSPLNPTLGEKDIEANEVVNEESVPFNDKIEELIDETKTPLEMNDNTEVTLVTDLSNNESKAVCEDNTLIEQKESKKENDVEKTETATSETIVIEDDDDVSIVEVVVENKNENENTVADSKSKAQVDENNEGNLKICVTTAIPSMDNRETEEITIRDADIIVVESVTTTSIVTDSGVQPKLKNETVIPEKELKKPSMSSNIKEDTVAPPVQGKPTNNEVASMEIMNKDISYKDNENVLVKPSVNDLKQIDLLPNVADDIQNNKPMESSEKKNAAPKDGTGKHVFAANISPLLEQKQQSLVTSRVGSIKSGLPEKTEEKNPSPSINDIRTVNKFVEQNREKKLFDVHSKNIPSKPIQVTGSTPVVAQMQVYSINAPPQHLNKNKAVSIVNSATELRKNTIPLPIKNITVDKPRPALDMKSSFTNQRNDKNEVKVPPKVREKASCVMNIEISKVPKVESVKTSTLVKQTDHSMDSKLNSQGLKNKIEPKDKKEVSKMTESKPINNNHAAVPFGKWTEANKQEFLNKFKTKTAVISSNSNQLKNSNDLNRRDVLKKIDSQRQSSTALSKTQEANKNTMKSEITFSNKPNIIIKESTQGSKILQNTDITEVKPKPTASINTTKIDVVPKNQIESQTSAVSSSSKKEVCQTKEKVQNLIDKTIEGMIHRNTHANKPQNEPKQNTAIDPNPPKTATSTIDPQTKKIKIIQQPTCDAKLDEIEMKMNELHGIPFIERPAHELPQVYKPETKAYSIIEKEKLAVPVKTKIPNLLPFPNKTQQKVSKESVIEVDSEDEIIEHEPITGDIDLNKKNLIVKPLVKEKLPIQQEKAAIEAPKIESIITEKDFDKFARRNSITCENYLTVNFEGKEPNNVVQTVVEKEPTLKNLSRIDTGRTDSKTKLSHKNQNVRPSTQAAKHHPGNTFVPATDDASNRNQSKLQKAYHSALTEKRQMASDCAITIIEDKPVKVLFVNNVEYGPTQLDVQGQDLSPVKKTVPDSDITDNICNSSHTDLLDPIDDVKSQDDVKGKTKHQRKQVLTPVEEPELELIEPQDLNIDVSPKKKRRIDDDKIDKNLKYPMRKKYLLGSSTVTEEKVTSPIATVKNPLKETVNLHDNGVAHNNPVSALDSLVKAAELIETQTETMNNSLTSNSDSHSSTPVKRGRGRPRKYPLTPDGTVDTSKVTAPSPQKKPRLIDAIKPKRDVTTDDDTDSEGEIIKENWTMGKINENIVCPICNKLFRTENVVFKHVKHCTGPSPNRSDSDKRSPRRTRIDSDSKSQDSKSDDMDIDDDKPLITQKVSLKKRKSKDSRSKSLEKDDIIVIEDTPIKEKPEKIEERKTHVSRKLTTKIPLKNDSLVCEFCGKIFRQLSYLVSHKLQHKKIQKVEPSKTEKIAPITDKSVYSCEVCKKEFRKLHHLVQHRIIHNPSSVTARSSRKSSSEHSENKVDKERSTSKQSDDPSAGFRCEPCDKSFRKLHHLVEHRETHDGINRQKTITAVPNKEEKPVEKPVVLHQCDICKKTFKKLSHLNEHKEQHVETSSEKSDDKSVKSSLSTKDIIHECSLCYMVFPNEHSLNKHTVFCQRKKRQSKQPKPADETEGSEDVIECLAPEEEIESLDSKKAEVSVMEKDVEKNEFVEKVEVAKDKLVEKESLDTVKEKPIEVIKIEEPEILLPKLEAKPPESQAPRTKNDLVIVETSHKEATAEMSEKIKKSEHKDCTKIHETPKKKILIKDKTASAAKRPKATAPSTSVTAEIKPVTESSDEDEIRYMLNPNFKVEDVTEEKVFMKVRAKKRSSLQIERPDSKDLMKRRTSLQHPPKIPRLKSKSMEANITVKKEVKTPKVEPVPSTDSDDSETTKYSFPSTIPEKSTKPAQNRTPKNSRKKSIVDKRKTLSGIAKRKSLGKAVTARHKLTPVKQVKKRTLDAEHRCDCGQLFSSAALLSRHTTLAHTPPRIRRRRSPPPDDKPIPKEKPAAKLAPRKSTAPENPKSNKSPQVAATRKSNVRSVSTASNVKLTKSEIKTGKKTLERNTKTPSDAKKAKSEKHEEESSVKSRRTAAHRGVPVPEKMKKLLGKTK